MAGPDDVPVGDLYDEPSDYKDGWWATHVEVTDPEVLGTLFVVRNGVAEPEEWTLLDRPIIPFGFSKET